MSHKPRNLTFKTRIGVISDTHIPRQAQQLPEGLLERLAELDFIIHAGDFEDVNTLKELQKVKRVVAVFGNMDSKGVKDQLRNKEIINVDHYRIGIIHGWGDPHSLPKRILDEFRADNVNCIVFGHSHQVYNQTTPAYAGASVFMFNPGSPTDTMFAHFRSFGILETSLGGIKGEIIHL